MFSTIMMRRILMRQLHCGCRLQYHKSAPNLVRGNFNSSLTINSDVTPSFKLDIKPSDLIAPSIKHAEEITLDEYKDSNIEEIKTGPFTKADPEFIDEMAPELPVSFNVASFVDRNEVMKQLLKLGVDLSILEQNRNVIEFLLTADFMRDIAPFIQFLVDVGVKPSKLGSVITRHPIIFDELIDNLKTRVQYLEHKKFTESAIVTIITKHPPYLSRTVKEVDSRLGHLQKEYKFSSNEVRHVLREYPEIVDLHLMQMRTTWIAIKEDMGYDKDQMKRMLIQVPSLFGGDRTDMVRIFDLLYNDSNIEHGLMVNFPEVLKGNLNTVKHRMEYLKKLKRDQFDPSKPRFIPLSVLAEGTDDLFVTKYARTSIDDYDYFLRCN